MEYRREIDGLRALSVLPVILFHAGVANFSGGYVGVDVFFVISGYLITSIILDETKNGMFSLIGFYERRARRILPALFFVMLVCLPLAFFILLPRDMYDFSESSAAVALFVSNLKLWGESGYFDTSDELKPFLHTWSLAVEEQYYLIFPLLLLTISWFGRKYITATFFVAAAVSLALAEWGVYHKPSSAFFLLPTRGWELLAGATLALFLHDGANVPRVPRTLGELLGAAGLLAIIASVFMYDRYTPFPGVHALLPVAGALLIIAFAHGNTLIGRFLGAKILVGIGLISYSAYLWHQPLFAFARHYSTDDVRPETYLVLAVLALALAWLTWKYVEAPFRNRRRTSRSLVFRSAAAAIVFFCGFGIAGHFTDGFAGVIVKRLNHEQQEVLAYQDYKIAGLYRVGTCFLQLDTDAHRFSPDCGKTETGSPTLMILGDSHAAALTAGIRRNFENVMQFTAAGCPPIALPALAPRCESIRTFVLQEIERLKPNEIFLHACWILYNRSEDGLAAGLAATINQIHALSPSTAVTVIGGVPQWFPSLPLVMLRKGRFLDREQALKMPSFDRLYALDQNIASVAARNGAHFMSILEPLCTGDECTAVIKTDHGYVPLTWDNAHLTEDGSDFVAGKLLAQWQRDRSKLAGKME